MRITVLCVGVFLYFFGIYYKPTEAIIVFQIISGAIYTTGAGTMIIFGLYWRRGNKYGAYAAMIVGALTPILNHIFKWKSGIEGCIMAYLAAMVVYIVISMLTKNPRFNIEKMLNRPSKVKE